MPSTIQKVIKAGRMVAKKTGRSPLAVMIDLILSKIRYKCDIYDYTVGKFYLLQPNVRKNFLTYGRRIPLYGKFNDKNYLVYLRNKRVFHKKFHEVAKRDWIGCDKATPEEIRAFLRRYGTGFAKPMIGTQGKGIFVLKAEDATEEMITKLQTDRYLLEEMVEQDERMAFGARSVNTLRMYTLMDRQGHVDVIKVVFRVGVGQAIMDNFHQGGVVYPVDLSTGIVEGRGTLMDFENDVLIHPGTDFTILGFHIPRWQEALDTVVKAAKMLPEVRYIGWDVAVTKTGIEIIEGNNMADMDLLQLVGHRMGHRVTYDDFLARM